VLRAVAAVSHNLERVISALRHSLDRLEAEIAGACEAAALGGRHTGPTA
jgi:hypothetical protein